jgi:hypothetical protein
MHASGYRNPQLKVLIRLFARGSNTHTMPKRKAAASSGPSEAKEAAPKEKRCFDVSTKIFHRIPGVSVLRSIFLNSGWQRQKLVLLKVCITMNQCVQLALRAQLGGSSLGMLLGSEHC